MLEEIEKKVEECKKLLKDIKNIGRDAKEFLNENNKKLKGL